MGAGGVGSWLAPGLAKMLEWSMPYSGLVIVDGDVYEPKNKERQNFNGYGNKADVLASDLAGDFEKTFIAPVPCWVVGSPKEAAIEQEASDDPDAPPPAGKIAVQDLLAENDVVYAVVDNFAARKLIFDEARNYENIDIFTGGNDDAFYGSIYHYCRKNGEDVTEHPGTRQPEYENPPDRNPGEMSCQERAEIEGGTQLLASNMSVAALLLARTKIQIVDQAEQDPQSEVFFDWNLGLAQSFDRSVSNETVAV